MAKVANLYFIQCKVSKGLFTTERQVTITLPGGREFIAFVDERNVKLKDPTPSQQAEWSVDGWVRVYPVEVTKQTAIVDLPQGSFTEGPRIEIPAKEIMQQ